MIVLKLKKMYLSALSIVMVVLVLLVLISISTYRNLDREEKNAMDSLHRQGTSLIHALSAGAKFGNDAIDPLFQETAESEEIAYIYLVDSRGVMIHHSNPAIRGTSAPQHTRIDVVNHERTSIHQLSDGLRIYEIVKTFGDRTNIVLGLKMASFDEARQADLHHAGIMAAIVVALGVGALFFILVIQNYYLVDKTLKTTQEEVRRSEKLAAIGRLAASVAHEIRNPLSSIKGFAQFLSHTLKDRPEDREYADIMVREIDRINSVVTDLLTYARPLTLERTRVNLPELVEHTVRLVKADARSGNVGITQRLDNNLTDLWMDENQITQALLNLLLNSLQAVSENGHIIVDAHIHRIDGFLHLWVEDDGKGVEAEHLDKIFDPFFTTRDKGTGLGLAIVHKIVENHHGEIRVDSPVPGKNAGTRISLLIPGLSP
jgi:signal transduction histidine kinase